MKFCVQNTKHKPEIMHKNFLQEVASSQKSEVQNPNKSSSEKWYLPEKQTTQRGPKQDPLADSPGILANTNWTKLLLVERASSTMPDSVTYMQHTRRN